MSEPDQAAPGVLGSDLLVAAIAHEKLKPRPVSSGCPWVDEAVLAGGFRYGDITSIAGASGTGKTLIALHTLTSHLLSSETAEAAFIDTTGAFSPIRLRDVIALRLQDQSPDVKFQESGYVYEPMPTEPQVMRDKLMQKATLLLDRVKVMRVFDFAGIVEAVGEVGDTWEQQATSSRGVSDAQSGERGKEIADSQGESEGEGSFDLIYKDSSYQQDGISKVQTRNMQLLVIDTITNALSSMMATAQVQGQAILSSFMRTLHHLSSRHHVCTLLINSAVGMNQSRNTRYPRKPEDDVSIFASTPGKPALGKTFAYLVDTSVFLSMVPKTRGDAEIAYGGGDPTQWNTVGVFEVLSDRHGTREGRWILYEIASESELRPVTFETD